MSTVRGPVFDILLSLPSRAVAATRRRFGKAKDAGYSGTASMSRDRRRRSRRVRIDDLDRHDPGPPGDARDPDPVVAARGDDAGHARPVAVVVARVGVVADGVPAVDVVD